MIPTVSLIGILTYKSLISKVIFYVFRQFSILLDHGLRLRNLLCYFGGLSLGIRLVSLPVVLIFCKLGN